MRIIAALFISAVCLFGQGKYQQLMLGDVDQPLTPTDSPGGGTYSSTQSVTLSDPTATLINYTTDGSTNPACPTGGTLYTGAISVSVTTTIKAIGCNGVTGSGILTSTYTINTANITFTVVGNGKSSSNGQTTIVSGSQSVTANDIITAFCKGKNGTNGLPTGVSDSNSNTYTSITSRLELSNHGFQVSAWRAKAANSTSITVTCTWATGDIDLPIVDWIALGGVNGTTPVDTSVSALDAASSNSFDAGNITTANANEALVTDCIHAGGGGTVAYTVASGYTKPSLTDTSDGNTYFTGALEYELDAGAAGSKATAYSSSPAKPGDWVCVAVALKK